MESWKIFDEQTLPDKDAFYISLSIEDITNIDYRHAKRVYKKFNIKSLGEYHDLYAQGDTLLLADVFENFGNMFYNIIVIRTRNIVWKHGPSQPFFLCNLSSENS